MPGLLEEAMDWALLWDLVQQILTPLQQARVLIRYVHERKPERQVITQ